MEYDVEFKKIIVSLDFWFFSSMEKNNEKTDCFLPRNEKKRRIIKWSSGSKKKLYVFYVSIVVNKKNKISLDFS